MGTGLSTFMDMLVSDEIRAVVAKTARPPRSIVVCDNDQRRT